MNDLRYASVYKVTDNTNGNIYYGSTTQSIHDRFVCHEAQHKKCGGCALSICPIILNQDYSVEVLEHFPENKTERLKREAHYITTYPCINKEVPGRTRKEHYAANSTEILRKKKEYELKNPDKVKQWNANKKAKRAIDGKDKIWRRNDYLKHREERLEKNKQYLKRQPTLTCQCGKSIKRLYMKKHLKTKQHRKWAHEQHQELNHL